jgi:hypothetical protein
MARTIARITTLLFAALYLGMAIYWLATFSENLHCTQTTSFRIATFDMIPHEEDEGPPLVYRSGFAFPLRHYFATSILAFFLVPPLASVQVIRRRLSWRQWVRITAGVSGLVLFNTLLPNIIVGERFWTLGAISLGLAAIPLLFLAGLVYLASGPHAASMTDAGPSWEWELSILPTARLQTAPPLPRSEPSPARPRT